VVIGRLRVTEALPDLVAMLINGEIVNYVIHAMVRLGDERAVQPISEYLLHGPEDVPEHESVSAAYALAELGQSGLSSLVQLTRSTRSPNRLYAAYGLNYARARFGIPALESAMADADPDVRREALWSRTWIDPNQPEHILMALDEPNKVTFHALQDTRNSRALEPVCRLLREGSYAVRLSACQALSKIPEIRATAALIECVLDVHGFQSTLNGGWGVRKEAAICLGMRREIDAVGALLEVLGSNVWEDLQCAAALALGAIGDSQAIPAMKKAVVHGDLMLLRAAAKALDRFGDRELCACNWRDKPYFS